MSEVQKQKKAKEMVNKPTTDNRQSNEIKSNKANIDQPGKGGGGDGVEFCGGNAKAREQQPLGRTQRNQQQMCTEKIDESYK